MRPLSILRALFGALVFTAIGAKAQSAVPESVLINLNASYACLISSAPNQLVSAKSATSGVQLDFLSEKASLAKQSGKLTKVIKKAKLALKKAKKAKDKKAIKKTNAKLKKQQSKLALISEELKAIGKCEATATTVIDAPCAFGVSQFCNDFSVCTDSDRCQGVKCLGDAVQNGAVLNCGVGACQNTVVVCDQGTLSNCVPGEPTAESCNGLDDDCDGVSDEDCFTSGTTCSADSQCLSGFCRFGVCCNSTCAGGFSCDGGECALKKGLGAACASGLECQSDSCVDGVCCNQDCSGTCQACDLAGSVGTCTAVPAGQDPDNECGAVSCSAFYFGFVGDTCFSKADVPANAATCSGASSCKSASVECAASGKGGPSSTCDDVCQNPSFFTCIGTVPGGCINVNPGNQSCGFGLCQVTVPQCVNGSSNTCVPNSGAATAESCNGVDDNCDGTIDNGALADPLEPNNSCAQFSVLTPQGSDSTFNYNTLNLFPSSDSDFYTITLNETDSTCSCGFPSFDEDYKFTASLTVPAGAGSYQLCLSNNSCGPFNSCVTVNAGNSGSLFLFLDGACGTSPDQYQMFIRVAPLNSPGFSCVPYVLTTEFDAGLCLL